MGALPFEPTAVDDYYFLPDEVTFISNYPNPFNSSTTIEVRIGKAEYVNISVINILGQTVETLYNGELTEGNYRLNWNAQTTNGELSTGIYFVAIQTNTFSQLRKMVLLK